MVGWVSTDASQAMPYCVRLALQLTSDRKPWVVDQTGNILRVAVLVDQMVLGDVMDQILNTLLVAGQRVVLVQAPITNISHQFKFLINKGGGLV